MHDKYFYIIHVLIDKINKLYNEKNTMINYLSIDFESWAHPDSPEFNNLTSLKRKKLDGGFVKKSAEVILKLLKKNNTKLTFFIVGQFYEWYPETIEMIEKEGHEIGYHMHEHELIHTKEILISSLKKSVYFLKRFRPKGFRAPRVLMQDSYLMILKEYGFEYDSSLYGDFSRTKIKSGIRQIPVSSLGPIPIGSGYFLGALGKFIRLGYREINKKGHPFVSFVHNWQILTPTKATFPDTKYLLTHPHYAPYLFNVYNTVEYLLKNYSFAPMQKLIKTL